MEKKTISISVKRQITIPQKFFEALNFGNEAECILREDGILIRPVRYTGGEFAEQILADLIEQGYSGKELLQKFRETSQRVRPAVEKLIEEADELARSGGGKASLDDLLGAEG